MKIIEPGHYKLSRDVQNPKPDRRSKDWDKISSWPAGTLIYVRAQEYGSSIEFVQSRWPTLHSIGPGCSEQYEAIGAALVPVEETYKRLLHRLSVRDTYWLLKRLVTSGKVTLADIELAADEEDAADKLPVTSADEI
jgi:hypothetical protein